MSKGNDPAYPSSKTWNDDNGNWGIPYGLSKREYFAGLAMQGILSNPGRCTPDFDGAPEQYSALMAKVALQFSDGLIEELEKTA